VREQRRLPSLEKFAMPATESVVLAERILEVSCAVQLFARDWDALRRVELETAGHMSMNAKRAS